MTVSAKANISKFTFARYGRVKQTAFPLHSHSVLQHHLLLLRLQQIITKDKSRADTYIEYLEKEMELLAPHLNGRHQLAQLHFGGGTPTF
ncbi:oxygen-independent coproporphyrinogen III oxidase [Neisseria gonorrhoeae]|uniref:Oxygen-independent coproporphyrinogen III oxidase n=1 Tax=Neisseria gonorrhoeae TaxID=485 RepID=A0A378VUY8_NEIGO|nr:oxygen-independent coproporphyrinogen III oxidase [Neisseria gonorrhoeae]